MSVSFDPVIWLLEYQRTVLEACWNRGGVCNTFVGSESQCGNVNSKIYKSQTSLTRSPDLEVSWRSFWRKLGKTLGGSFVWCRDYCPSEHCKSKLRPGSSAEIPCRWLPFGMTKLREAVLRDFYRNQNRCPFHVGKHEVILQHVQRAIVMIQVLVLSHVLKHPAEPSRMFPYDQLFLEQNIWCHSDSQWSLLKGH